MIWLRRPACTPSADQSAWPAVALGGLDKFSCDFDVVGSSKPGTSSVRLVRAVAAVKTEA